MIAQLFKENKVRFSKRTTKQNQKPKKQKKVVSKPATGQMGFGF